MPNLSKSKVWEHPDSHLYVVEMPSQPKPPGNCSAGGHSITAGTRYLILDQQPGVDLFPRIVQMLFCGKSEVVAYLRLMGENSGNPIYGQAANWFADQLPDDPGPN